MILIVLSAISRNSAVFNWKSMYLIGSPYVDYSLIEHNHAHMVRFQKISILNPKMVNGNSEGKGGLNSPNS